MYGAIHSVQHDGMSIRRAAEQYGVPKSSLVDRLTGRVLADAHVVQLHTFQLERRRS
jgi:hypothetical protein